VITQRAQLHLSLVDASNSIGNMSLWLKDGVDLAAAASAAASFRALAAACMDVVFVRQSIVFSAVAAPVPSAGASADCTRVGVFVFSTSDTEFGMVELNGVKDSELITTGPGTGLLIDLDNSAIAALVTELLSGFWCNPFGQPLLGIEAAFLQIRR
jgi:hypothetical protein